jgi:NAD(P)-dependent dehydrogenase (short-subunit alcohol dehydrogenase family)
MSAGSRLVNLSSAGHRFSDVDLEDPGFDHTPYNEFGAYGRSKTANILFAVDFDRRHKAKGVRGTAVHPGGIRTELSRHMDPKATQAMIERINAEMQSKGGPKFEYKTVPQGAATSVWAGVVAPDDLIGGLYCEDCHVAEVVDDAAFRGGVRPYALDRERARALWALSEQMVGETFD